ncbi:MAG: ProQ/FINO family protein [Succinivibrionaceae bacterium]
MTEQTSLSVQENVNGESAPKNLPASRKHSIKEIVDFLHQKFPNCIFVENEKVRPLKIGIIDDMVAALGDEIGSDKSYSKTSIRQGLKAYANSRAYLDSCVKGAKRIDINGVEGDEISEEHVTYSISRKEELAKKAKALHLSKKPMSKKPRGSKGPIRKLTLPEMEKADPAKLQVDDTIYIQVSGRMMRAAVGKIEKNCIYARFRTGKVAKVRLADVYKPV